MMKFMCEFVTLIDHVVQAFQCVQGYQVYGNGQIICHQKCIMGTVHLLPYTKGLASFTQLVKVRGGNLVLALPSIFDRKW